MQVQQQLRSVETEGLEHDQKVFKVSQNKRMFEILSSNIYSDKILAVVREYGCNAYDAHIAAGKADVPFEVHLPNRFEPWFAVKDFGTGLSHEDVMELYSTYGLSTKNNENNSIGMLGLGSKSGFAYSDQFTVISRHNGKIRTYGAFISGGGTPTITLLSEEDTNQENGLEINIPAKTDDYEDFKSRAKKIFFRFPTLPTIVGNSCDLLQIEPVLSGPNYIIRGRDPDQPYYSGPRGAFAVQGTVAYPIDTSAFTSGRLSYDQERLLDKLPIDIIFPIGELDVAASRESLNYDNFTQANIVKAMDAVVEHLPSHFENVLSNCKTLWQAKTFYSDFIEASGEAEKVIQETLDLKVKWKDEPIRSSIIEVRMWDVFDKQLPAGLNDKGEMTFTDVKFKEPICEIVEFTGKGLNEGGKVNRYSTANLKIDLKNDVKIIFEDKKLRSHVRSMQILHLEEPVDQVLLIRDFKPEDQEKILERFGNPDTWYYTSDMEEPAPPPRKPKEKKEVVDFYKVTSFDETDIHKTQTKTSITRGGYYFVTYAGSPIDVASKDPKATDSSLVRLYSQCEDLGLMRDDKIYVVNFTQRKKLEKEPNWKPLHTMLEAKMQKYSKDRVLNRAWAFFKALNEQSLKNKELQEFLNNYMNLQKNIKKEDFNSEFSSLLRKINLYARIINTRMGLKKHNIMWYLSTSRIYTKMIRKMNVVEIKTKKYPISLKYEYSKLTNQYPALGALINVARYGWGIDDKTVAHYIQLCNAAPEVATLYKPKGDK